MMIQLEVWCVYVTCNDKENPKTASLLSQAESACQATCTPPKAGTNQMCINAHTHTVYRHHLDCTAFTHTPTFQHESAVILPKRSYNLTIFSPPPASISLTPSLHLLFFPSHCFGMHHEQVLRITLLHAAKLLLYVLL